jgi:hypothetical protein
MVNRFNIEFGLICFKMNRNAGTCQEFAGGNLNGRQGAPDLSMATARPLSKAENRQQPWKTGLLNRFLMITMPP